MTIRKSLTALVVTGLMMGITSFEGRTMMKEEEEMTGSFFLAHYQDAILEDIEKGNFTKDKLKEISEKVSPFKILKPASDNLYGLVSQAIEYIESGGEYNCSEKYAKNYLSFFKTIKPEIEKMDFSLAYFIKNLTIRINREMIY